jgi:AAA domain
MRYARPPDLNKINNPELRATLLELKQQQEGTTPHPQTLAAKRSITSELRMFTAADLQTMTFPPLKFILPGLVPEGATLLVSRPKLGKSWLVLDIAIAIAAGRFTLGDLKPSLGDVLYLALEDGRRRLQRRITKLLPTFSGSWPPGLTIATEWRRADHGGLDDIEQWLKAATTRRLVIVDTLALFRRISSGKSQVYLEDYAAISSLQKLAIKYNVGIIIVHHDRKAEADDVFDTISGSLGLPAAADTILIVKRQSGAVTLHVRGRDIEEAELALQFSKDTCRWTILGTAADVHRSAERNRVLDVLRSADTPWQAKDIQFMAELRTRNATDILLGKMVRDGEIVRAERGRYADRQVAGQIRGGVSFKVRTDRTDRQIGAEDPELKEGIKTDNLSGNLSASCATSPNRPNLSNLSDLSRRGRSGPVLADDFPDLPDLRRAPPPEPQVNDHASALSSANSLEDF